MSSEEKAKELAEKYGNQTAIAICEEMKKMLNEWKSPVAFCGFVSVCPLHKVSSYYKC